MRYFTFSFAYKVFEIQCVFYAYTTFQFRLAIFQVLKSHTWLMGPNWTVEVYRVVGTVWSYASGISLLYLQKSYGKTQDPQQDLSFLDNKDTETGFFREVSMCMSLRVAEKPCWVSVGQRDQHCLRSSSRDLRAYCSPLETAVSAESRSKLHALTFAEHCCC